MCEEAIARLPRSALCIQERQFDKMIMELLYKPDCEEALRRWEAFWHGELIDRPPTVITVRREGAPERPAKSQLAGLDGDFAQVLDEFEEWAETIYFAGEAIPEFRPGLGPDQFAAFMGGKIEFSEEHDTSWVLPSVEDWADFMPLQIDPENQYWQHVLAFSQVAGQRAAGKFLVTTLDMHSNLDALAALRGYQQFCLDMIDQPEVVDRVVAEVIKLYEPIYNGVFRAAQMARVGWTTSWAGMAYPGKGEMTQCDFSALVSPEMFERWLRPALDAECEFLDHSFYHLDGPDALVHLPALLSLPKLHGIQWVPGGRLATERPQHTWVDIFQTVQKAGKAVQIWGDVEAIKWIHPQLRPELVMYLPNCSSPTEADELLAWLCQNS